MRESVDLPPQVHVLEQRLREALELRALLGSHRVEQLLHLRHRLRHLLQQLVETLRVARKELSVLLHELLEVRLFTALALLEHLVELGEHVLHALHPLRRHVLHPFGHLVEVALHELLAQLVHQLFEPLAGGVVHEVVLLERLHLAREIRRELVELLTALASEIFHDLLPPTIVGVAHVVEAPLDALTFLVDDVTELLRDVVVHPAEVAPLELLPAPLLQAFDHVSQTHEVLPVAVPHPLLHQPAQRGVEIAVIQQVVGHLREEGVRVEIEADLRTVPAGVSETGARHEIEPIPLAATTILGATTLALRHPLRSVPPNPACARRP